MSVPSKTLPSTKVPWQARLFLSAFSLAVDRSLRSDGTVNRFLMSFFDMKTKASPLPKPHQNVVSIDVTVDPSPDLWFRLFVPQKHVIAKYDSTTTTSSAALPVIFYFHGGGFVFLAANSKPYHDFCSRLATELNAIIVSVNYRLAPEHPYPSQFEDGYSVMKFVDDLGGFQLEGIQVNADLNRCFIAGDSAGGNIAHHVAVKAGEENNNTNNDSFKNVKVIGSIPIQPYFGGVERTEAEKDTGSSVVSVKRTDWMWKALLPEALDRDHQVVNVSGPKSRDLTKVKLPATLLVVGGLDPLRDWQKRYYEKMKGSGKEIEIKEYPNAIHSFYAFPEIHESGLFIGDVKAFMDKQSLKTRQE